MPLSFRFIRLLFISFHVESLLYSFVADLSLHAKIHIWMRKIVQFTDFPILRIREFLFENLSIIIRRFDNSAIWRIKISKNLLVFFLNRDIHNIILGGDMQNVKIQAFRESEFLHSDVSICS